MIESAGEDPGHRFEHWDIKDFPHLVPAIKGLISEMVRLTPAERLTIHQVMEHHSWGERA